MPTLVGATGNGRSKAEAGYYRHLNKNYKGVAEWHKNLGEEAIRFNKITNFSGRQYAFPEVTRRSNGTPSHFTMIKNYPVQGFATGDVVPVVLNEIDARLNSFHSCIVNIVQDSMLLQVYPNEKEKIASIINYISEQLVLLI